MLWKQCAFMCLSQYLQCCCIFCKQLKCLQWMSVFVVHVFKALEHKMWVQKRINLKYKVFICVSD